MTPRTIKGGQKLLRGLLQEVKVSIFIWVKFLLIFTKLSEDSGGHIFQPNTKCLTISESLRPTLNYPIKLIDL